MTTLRKLEGQFLAKGFTVSIIQQEDGYDLQVYNEADDLPFITLYFDDKEEAADIY